MDFLVWIQTAVGGLFALAVAANLALQARRGIRAFVLSPEPLRRRIEALAISLLAAWFLVACTEGVPWVGSRLGPKLASALWLDLLGAALMIGGLAIGLLAYLHMGRSWRIGIDEDSKEELVTSGVFRISRNPIYLFIDLFALGVLFMSGTLFFAITSPLVLIGVHLRILEEERFLRRRYENAFEAYCRRTRRYLGMRES